MLLLCSSLVYIYFRNRISHDNTNCIRIFRPNHPQIFSTDTYIMGHYDCCYPVVHVYTYYENAARYRPYMAVLYSIFTSFYLK